MCGRYVLPEEEALQAFGPFAGGCCACAFRPRYNVPPTAQVPIVVPAAAGRQLRSARWGFVPGWWTKETPPPRTFNARAEDAAEKTIWREAWRTGRCLMPARGWFEWRAGETARAAKQPYFIACPDAPVFAFAGLWSLRETPGAEPAASCAVLTTTAAPGIAFIHPRMPVVLKPEQIAAWLDPATPAADLAGLVAAARADFAAVPVGPRVNDVRNDDAGLLERVAAAGTGDLFGG